MTVAENERLAVVETKLDAVIVDLTGIKDDVKTLLSTRSQWTGAGAMFVRALPFVALGVSVATIWAR